MKSRCCHADVTVGGKGSTHYYVCSSCELACFTVEDPPVADQEPTAEDRAFEIAEDVVEAWHCSADFVGGLPDLSMDVLTRKIAKALRAERYLGERADTVQKAKEEGFDAGWEACLTSFYGARGRLSEAVMDLVTAFGNSLWRPATKITAAVQKARAEERERCANVLDELGDISCVCGEDGIHSESCPAIAFYEGAIAIRALAERGEGEKA